MTTKSRIEPMTLEEFERSYAAEGPFEFIQGEKRPIVSTKTLHNLLMRVLFNRLYTYCAAHHLGEVFFEMTFVLTLNSKQWVSGSRQPDLSFYAADRWTQYLAKNPAWEATPTVLVPDLVVEYVSASDLLSDVEEKAELYIADGVREVWLVYPARRRVRVVIGNVTTLYQAADILKSSVVAGFEIPLDELFTTG